MSEFNKAARIFPLRGGHQLWTNPGRIGQLFREEFFPPDAPVGNEKILSAGGSFSLTGNNRMRRERVQVPSGSVPFSGAAALRRERVTQASGSILFSGTAPFRLEASLSSGGQVTFSGSAAMIFEPAAPGAGDAVGRNLFIGVGAKSRLS